MEQDTRKFADYLFEVSWEVCNKVGGIHTVVATKAPSAQQRWGDHYILIGPDLTRNGPNHEFEEDPKLLERWRKVAYNEGLPIKIGRWKITGSPIVVLVDVGSLISRKDLLLLNLWEDFKVDSLNAGWDYIEPVLFGFAAAKVIESYKDHHARSSQTVMAHFHEWMTASGGLYLRKHVPSVVTLFTTHATVVGRCIASNGLPLYNDMESYNAQEIAARFGVVAKHAIEKAAAQNCDGFTTVSQITAHECKVLLDKQISQLTPNGFDDSFVFTGEDYNIKRSEARQALIHTAEVALGVRYESEPLLICTCGRYEFRNKGIDEFIDALSLLNERQELERDILAYIMVPCWHHGPRRDLQAKLAGSENQGYDHGNILNTTHYLGDQDNDPMVRRLRERGLEGVSNRVKVILVPCYLNGYDGIFNKSYYELLVGMDVTVFPSYYEPWGYTPLESIAFGIPTITTTLAGFGLWVEAHATAGQETGVSVIPRDDLNSPSVTRSIADILTRHAACDAPTTEQIRQAARRTSRIALWSSLFINYEKAYEKALETAEKRQKAERLDGGASHEQVNFVRQQLLPQNRPSWTRMIVDRSMPEELKKLEALSRNLWWSWNESARSLFDHIDHEKWNAVECNPIALLDKLSPGQLRALVGDQTFIDRMNRVYDEFQAYMSHKGETEAQKPHIGYFSMEFGLHASLKIYSGGLGILAGDYLKESSDKNLPLTGVGLLYRYGYFTQRLSHAGDQEAGYEAQNFDKLPITPVRDEKGNWRTISLALPGRSVTARIWRCDVGRTELYLLDTDFEANHDEDRAITHHLYGGDWDTRFRQEVLLGVGGVRALRELGIKPDVYHCNEGHAAFLGLEQLYNYISDYDLSFSEALEAVRSSSLFTTHTPVPAGHDAFPEDMIRQYMSHYPDRLKITWDQMINLGKTNPNDPNQKFSMSILAANLSQEVNGVSWLHGEVSKDILSNMWPGYMPCESHIGYVTNGVHFPTWTASRLKDIYYRQFGQEFRQGDYSQVHWNKIYDLPDRELWEARLYLKNRLLKLVRHRMSDPTQFSYDSPRQLVQLQENLKKDVLTIGFARRFATYKRAHLLFTNMERLASIVNNPEHPVQFIFAGKAHPADKAGQDLIKRIVEVSKMPQFVGKVIFLQNYDMELARRMVQGVDVWLNTPTRPLEASGTSGEKAVMNGVMHFSVLDGWWVEGYKEGAGWQLPMKRTFDEQRFQDELDAEMVYATIEDQIVPQYYTRNAENVPERWTNTIKNCIAQVASHFTTNRMMQDYEDRFYNKLYNRHRTLIADDFALTRQIAAWKRRVSSLWDNVRIVETKQLDTTRETLQRGQTYSLEVTVDIDGLNPEDIGVELLIAEQITDITKININSVYQFERQQVDNNIVKYHLDVEPDISGSYDTAIRVYARNEKLPHRMDFALVKWA